MGKLITLNDVKDTSVINKIFDNKIIVIEDIQGSKIFVNWTGENIQIKPKNLTNEPINLVDLALQKFYNKCIDHFSSLDKRVKSLLNKNWWFQFEYFPDEQPANINYDRVPLNNLVLTGIAKNGKFNYTYEELVEYSTLLNVNHIPILFKGQLSNLQKEAVSYFLNTSKNDLDYIFDETSFTYFFYKLLNPSLQSSFLMNNENFQENLEKLIIKLDIANDDISFQILNPLYEKVSDTNSTEFVEVYSLMLLNFLQFCQLVDFKKIKLSSKRRDELYLELICKIFNIYIGNVKDDILGFNFVIPKFFNKDKFKLNIEVLPNKLTKEYVEENPKIEYLFKIILGSFNKKRKKEIGVFTKNTLDLFNRFVDKVNAFIDYNLNISHEIELAKSGLLNFDDYYKIKWDEDAEGKVYTNVADEIEEMEEKSKKKPAVYGKEEFEPIDIEEEPTDLKNNDEENDNIQ